MLSGEAGKGDTYRPVDRMMWSKNWDEIFNRKKPKKARTAKNVNQSRKENKNGQG